MIKQSASDQFKTIMELLKTFLVGLWFCNQEQNWVCDLPLIVSVKKKQKIMFYTCLMDLSAAPIYHLSSEPAVLYDRSFTSELSVLRFLPLSAFGFDLNRECSPSDVSMQWPMKPHATSTPGGYNKLWFWRHLYNGNYHRSSFLVFQTCAIQLWTDCVNVTDS